MPINSVRSIYPCFVYILLHFILEETPRQELRPRHPYRPLVRAATCKHDSEILRNDAIASASIFNNDNLLLTIKLIQINKINSRLPLPGRRHTLEYASENQDSGLGSNNNPRKGDPPKPAEADRDAISDDDTSHFESIKVEISPLCHENPEGADI